MKKIIITLIPGGLLIDAEGLVGVIINPAATISEKFFLTTMNETTTVCMN